MRDPDNPVTEPMQPTISNLSTEDLYEAVQNKTFQNREQSLIDIRPMAAFNGWRMKNEKRGGHIPGAKSIPLAWTRFMDWGEVLEEKRVSKRQPVVIYGYTSAETENMARQLQDLGYRQILIYDDFLDEWSADSALQLDHLERYQHLVYPEWVHQLINGSPPEGVDRENVVICHAHFSHPEDYQKGHIPGAVPLDTLMLEAEETWNRRTPEELARSLGRLGISRDTTVVLYGRFSTPSFHEQASPGRYAGHLGAMRCAAIMLYAGVEDVRILNGGLTSWEQAGYELSQEDVQPEPSADFGVPIPARPEYIIDTPDARRLLESPVGELVSVRSWKEFIGLYSGYHYIEKKGEIPGAVFGNCGSDAYHMENYRNFDHTMRDFHEVAEKWEEAGITSDKEIAFYCGTGWRGSEAFMNAWLMGWPNVSVYDGGWLEWSSDPSNPIATGVPEDQQDARRRTG